MTAPNLLGFGHRQDNCAPSCFTQVKRIQLRDRRRPLGIVAAAEPAPRWLQRDGGVPPLQEDRHRRGRDLHTEAFDSQGNYANSSDTLFRLTGTYLAPDDSPPQPKD